jgi:pyrroline-5-carboxylate reductase
MSTKKAAVLGGGNIGLSIAQGLVNSKLYSARNIFLTRRNPAPLQQYAELGYNVTNNNHKAVTESDIIIIAVQPQQLDGLLNEIKNDLNEKKHTLISVVSGASVKAIKTQIQRLQLRIK